MTQADWTTPGAFEVAEGVYRIPLPLPNDALRAVNVYAVLDGSAGIVMVDGGWALQAAEDLLAAALGGLGLGLGDISRFLVTHAHRDHYTQAVAVRRRFGSRVSLGEKEKPNFDMGAGRGLHELPQLRMLQRAGAEDLSRTLREAGHESPDADNWEDPDDWLTSGTTVTVAQHTLTALHTPGHTRGHLVYHAPQAGLLFAGDHVLPHITPSIGFEQAVVPSPLADYLTSLQLVRAMPDARLLPAHGPVAQSVHERVDELLHHHAERLDASLAALAQGADSAFEVADRLLWTRRNRRLSELDPNNQMLAVLETAAHLEVLCERGLARRSETTDRVHYAMPASGS